MTNPKEHIERKINNVIKYALLTHIVSSVQHTIQKKLIVQYTVIIGQLNMVMKRVALIVLPHFKLIRQSSFSQLIFHV